MRRTLLALFIAVSCLVGCKPRDEASAVRADTPAVDPDMKDWTFLVFAAGDETDVRKGTYFMIKRFEKIEALKDNSRVNIVIQHDDVGDDKNYRYEAAYVPHISNKMKIDLPPVPEEQIAAVSPGFQYRELDSGDPVVLKDFIRWGVKAYPARHYALILSGHSWGREGVMQDFFVDGKDLDESTMIKIYELRRVMEEIYRENRDLIPEGQFDSLFIDACVTGHLEVMLELKDVFKYMTASSIETPYIGVPYDKILDPFVRIVNDNPGASAEKTKELLEDYYLKPLTTLYVKAHRPGSEYTRLEGEASLTESMTVRTSRIEEVSEALKNFITSLPQEALASWRQGRMRTINGIADPDGNGDLLQMARNYRVYLEAKFNETGKAEWKNAAAAAQAFEDSFGYHAEDPTIEPTAIKHPQAAGAWVHVDIDAVPDAGSSTCLALRALVNLNAGVQGVLPKFKKADGGEVVAAEMDCHGLHDDLHQPAGAELTSTPKPKPMVKPTQWDEFLGVGITWPSGVPAFLTEYDAKGQPAEFETDELQNRIDAQRVTRRVLSIWVPKGGGALSKQLILHLPGTNNIGIDYLKDKPLKFIKREGSYQSLVLDHQEQKVAAYMTAFDAKDFELKAHPGEDGLYVAEAHSNASHFKHGIGAYMRRKLPEFSNYNGGRLPIEKVEQTPFALTLDAYFARLTQEGKKEEQAISGIPFYRMHRIDASLWPEFLFGKDGN